MLEVEEVDKAVTPQHLVGKVGGASLEEMHVAPKILNGNEDHTHLNCVACLLDHPLQDHHDLIPNDAYCTFSIIFGQNHVIVNLFVAI